MQFTSFAWKDIVEFYDPNTPASERQAKLQLKTAAANFDGNVFTYKIKIKAILANLGERAPKNEKIILWMLLGILNSPVSGDVDDETSWSNFVMDHDTSERTKPDLETFFRRAEYRSHLLQEVDIWSEKDKQSSARALEFIPAKSPTPQAPATQRGTVQALPLLQVQALPAPPSGDRDPVETPGSSGAAKRRRRRRRPPRHIRLQQQFEESVSHQNAAQTHLAETQLYMQQQQQLASHLKEQQMQQHIDHTLMLQQHYITQMMEEAIAREREALGLQHKHVAEHMHAQNPQQQLALHLMSSLNTS